MTTGGYSAPPSPTTTNKKASHEGGSYEDHAHKGAELARKILNELKLTDEAETEIICSAINHHDDKLVVDSPMDEALKNAEYYTPVILGEDLVGTVISFEATDLDGNPVRSEDIFKDHEVTMVNLWATWCHNCIREMTELGEMAERYAEKGVALVGICTDADDELDACREILKEHNVNYLNLMPVEDLDELLQWNGTLPTSYFFGSDGTLLCLGFTGAPQTMEPYEEIINGFLNGEAVETEMPDTPHTAANDEGVYRVVVSDTDGNKVKGATVQFCSDTTCTMGKTDANGVAVFEMEEGPIYTVHILKVPEGYVKNDGEYFTDNTYWKRQHKA